MTTAATADDDPVKRYLAAVERVRAARATRVTPAIRDAILRELRLDEEEIARARKHGQEQLRRGEKMVRHEMWDDAIRVLSEADALLPEDVTVLEALATAHARRNRVTATLDDARHARELCERILQKEPQRESTLHLYDELKRGKAGQRLTRRQRYLLATLALVVSFSALGYSLATAPWFVQFRIRPLRCADGGSACAVAVPLSPVQALDDAGVRLEYETHQLQIDGESRRLVVSGRLTIKALAELERLRVNVRLVDAAGRGVGEEAVELMATSAPPLRRGDTRPFHFEFEVPLYTARAEVFVDDFRPLPAPNEYPRTASLPLGGVPTKWKLGAAVRTHSVHVTGAHTSAEGILEIVNSGTTPVRALTVELVAVDANGHELGTPVRVPFANAKDPPLAPGERRAERFALYAPGNPVAERVTVAVIE